MNIEEERLFIATMQKQLDKNKKKAILNDALFCILAVCASALLTYFVVTTLDKL